jgi:hypothetical protein
MYCVCLVLLFPICTCRVKYSDPLFSPILRLCGMRSAARKKDKQLPTRQDQMVQMHFIFSRFVYILFEIFIVVRFYEQNLASLKNEQRIQSPPLLPMSVAVTRTCLNSSYGLFEGRLKIVECCASCRNWMNLGYYCPELENMGASAKHHNWFMYLSHRVFMGPLEHGPITYVL